MAWIPALIGVAASLYGQHQASKNAKSLQGQQQPLIDQQLANMKMLQPYAQQFLGQGADSLSFVRSYLQSLASGNRALTMQTLAPEINALTASQTGATQAARSLYPRGGQTASQSAQLPYQLQGNINNLIMGARPQAINSLGALGSNMSSLGLGALGQSSGLSNNLLNYGLNAQGQMFNQGAMIGQGISSLLGPFMQYYIMNQNKSMPVDGSGGGNLYGGYTNPNTFGGYSLLNPSNNSGSSGFSMIPSSQGSAGSTYSPTSNPYGG